MTESQKRKYCIVLPNAVSNPGSWLNDAASILYLLGITALVVFALTRF